MDFLILNLYLYVMCVPALLVLRLGQKGLMSSLASFFILILPERKPENRSMFVAGASVAIFGIAFLYMAGAWSAFCVLIARTIAARETVTWDWLYLGASFVWCVQILLWGINLFKLYPRVTTETRAVWDQAILTFKSTFAASLIICGLAVLCWIIFAIWPGLISIPYGWALNPLMRGVDRIDDFLKTNWWLPLLVLSFAFISLLISRGRMLDPKWRAWGAELDRVVFMTETFSSDWGGYGKAEFLQKMPGTWGGATAEDRGTYVLVSNPELYKYFEFHFMFGEQQDAPMSFLYVRGLKELQGLWILGQADEMVLSLRPADGDSLSQDAKRAAAILKKKFNHLFAE